MTPLDFALGYAALGWRVHPIPRGMKHPAGHNKWQTNATTDPAKIRKHWTKHPDDGVCIATGQVSGIFAIDIDPIEGGDDSLRALEAQYGPLPDTAESITGRGGRHLLYRWPTEGEILNNQSGRLGIGIDVRGTGGQIVVAPSTHPTLVCKQCTTNAPCLAADYTWEVLHDPLDGHPIADAPDWLLELLQTDPRANEPRRPALPRLGADPLPGDWWENQTSWPDELAKRGWTLHSTHHDAAGGYYELWTRPGKTIAAGASASLYYQGSNVLKVFSSNAQPLKPDATYSLWGFHVAHEHDDDYTAAASAVRATMQAAAASARSSVDSSTPGATEVSVATDKPKTKPAIIHNGRQLNKVVDEAIAAIHDGNTPPTTFVRAGQLVRLREDENKRPMIETLRAEHIRSTLSNAANWYRSLKDGGLTDTSPPLDVAVSVLVTGNWPYPALAGVVELPVLRPDGSFHVDHGHDDATRLYHWHRGRAYDPIPDTPTATQLATAVALIDELFGDFPWDTAADRANAWALLLTPLVRAIIGQVPMALIDAPEPGTGKGLLVKVCSIITTGHAAALMAWPANDEELEKKISATLMAGNTVVVFDNVEGMIKSPTLAAVLTADSWQGRILGRSEVVVVPNRATWAATGNNIDVGGDLARRCYRIRLDAHQAQPWLRTGWKHNDLEGWTHEHRSDLLHALCIIVRSWWAAGRPQATELPAMGGYSAWVRTVGGILQHAGVTHFLANLAEFHASADREAGAWEAFLTAWFEHYKEEPLTVAQLVTKMSDVQLGHRLRDYLPDDLAGEFDRPQFSKKLGMALRKRCGRHYGTNGLHIVEMPRDRQRVGIYSVTNRSAQLFPTDQTDAVALAQAAGPARNHVEVPRGDNALTSDDALNARDRGTYSPPLQGENSTEILGSSDPTKSRESRGPAPQYDDNELF